MKFMDKTLKRRLVGATILIALAVIFVPMLLSPPDDELDDRQVAIDIPPAPEPGREVRRIPLDPDTARRPTPEADPAGDPDFRADPPRAEPETDAELEPESEPESGSEPELEQESEPEQEFEAEPESGAEPGTETISIDRDGDWVVQVASFGSPEVAGSVSDRLESLGHWVMTDEIERGDSRLHRLRTGPYASEETAAQARAQIVATVAGVEPLVRRISSDGDTSDRNGYAVQVGSFASQDNAENLTGRLTDQGFDAFSFEDSAGGRRIWRVRVGPEADRDAAEVLLARLSDEARVEGMVVSHP